MKNTVQSPVTNNLFRADPERNAAVLLDANAVRAAPARRTVRAARKAANAVQTASAVTANVPARNAARATRNAVKR
ncbi:hypothetical protein ANCDUO_14159, partial [Ancylostoma duodenale]